MSLADILQFLHVASAFLFVTGLVGRNLMINLARRTPDVVGMRTFLEAASPFDRFMVVPGSFLVLVSGVLTWWAQGLPLWGEGTRWVTVSLLIFASNIPLVPAAFIPRGRVFEAALARAMEERSRTPELSAAFHDPAVAAARWYESLSVTVVILLMVTKPSRLLSPKIR